MIEASSLVLELATDTLHLLNLLTHGVPAVLDEFELKPPGISGVEVAHEQHAWYVEVCVRA